MQGQGRDMLFPGTMKTSMKTTKAVFIILAITTTALAFQVQAQSFLTNGLVAYYPFNGNANDESGNGYNGTVHGALLDADRFGRPASCYSFNGSNSYIELPPNTGNLNGLTQTTILAWMKLTVSSNSGCIFSHAYLGPVAGIVPMGIVFGTASSNQLWGISQWRTCRIPLSQFLPTVVIRGNGIRRNPTANKQGAVLHEWKAAWRRGLQSFYDSRLHLIVGDQYANW